MREDFYYHFISRLNDKDFASWLGILDFQLKENTRIYQKIIDRLEHLNVNEYPAVSNSLERTLRISGYPIELSIKAIFINWLLGNYNRAESIAQVVLQKYDGNQEGLIKNIIFLYFVMGEHDKALEISKMHPNYSDLTDFTVKQLKSGEPLEVRFPEYEEVVRFHVSTFSNHSIHTAMDHFMGKFSEEDELKHMIVHANGSNVLDIGSCIGNHSLFFSKICKSRFLHALDIDNRCCLATRTNLSLNNIPEEKYKVTNASVIKSDQSSINEYSLASDNHAYDFIKIDIDGAELAFISDSTDYLIKIRPTLFIEVNKSNNAAINSIMSQLNYRSIVISERQSIEQNILFIPSENAIKQIF